MKTHRHLAAAFALFLHVSFVVHAQDATAPDDPAAPAKLPNPAVEAVLAKEANSPGEQLQQILTLVDLDAAESARALLEQFELDALDDAERSQLARTVGSAQLLKLSRIEALAPEAGQLAAALLDAASRAARSPARLAALALQLADPAAAKRRQAIVDLLEAGQDGAAFCVAALADPQSQPAHAGLADALVAYGPLAVGPLLGALDAGDDDFRARVIDVLGRIGTQRATPRLLLPAVAPLETASRQAARAALENTVGQVPTRGEAEQMLAELFERRMQGVLPMRADAEGRVNVWHWDGEKGQVVVEQLAATDAAVIMAHAIAEDLAMLEADNRTYQVWRLLTALEVDKLRHGYDQPLPTGQGTARALLSSPDGGALNDIALLEAVLSTALDRDGMADRRLFGAALGAVELLGEVSQADLLLRHSPEPSPLIAALDAGDRRLRMTALAAIMQINPDREYPGASRVAEATVDMARSTGQPLAIVGNTRLAAAQTLAARLAQAGVDTRAANTGRQLIALARESADTEMVIIDAAIRRPPVREVVYRLRTSPQTGSVPIALLASTTNVGRARAIAADDPLTIVQFRPHDQQAVDALVEQLRSVAGRSAISRDERLAQAGTALGWIAQLSPAQLKLYNLGSSSAEIEASLVVPELTAAAAAVLATLGQPSSQRALVDFASQPADIEARQAAATAFAESVRRHGVLLTKHEIEQQFDRYNQSETADKATQDVLASILDAIESKQKQRVESQESRDRTE